MGRRLVLVLLVALAAAETNAHAAEPAPGGRYVGDLRGAVRCDGCVEVNLANDGGELVNPSGAGDRFECGGADFVLESSWAGGLTRPWRSTAVRQQGHFFEPQRDPSRPLPFRG